MRCMSLAKAAVKLGCSVFFAVDSDYGADLITANGFNFVVSDALDAIEQFEPDFTIVDSYSVTYEFLSKLRSKTRLAYIDDLYMFDYPVDVLINYNAYAESMNYKMECRYILGPAYAPLRDEFIGLPTKKVEPIVKNILITTGSTDDFGFCSTLIKRGNLSEDVTYNIVVGKFFDADKLTKLAGKRMNVTLHFNVSAMSKLMLENDLCISACGSTLYELCACGLPTVCFSLADNQLPGAKAFCDSGLMLYAGDVRTGLEPIVNKALELIESLDVNVRKELSSRQQLLVDGMGAFRVIEQLMP